MTNHEAVVMWQGPGSPHYIAMCTCGSDDEFDAVMDASGTYVFDRNQFYMHVERCRGQERVVNMSKDNLIGVDEIGLAFVRADSLKPHDAVMLNHEWWHVINVDTLGTSAYRIWIATIDNNTTSVNVDKYCGILRP